MRIKNKLPLNQLKKGQNMNTLNIKEWANKIDAEHRTTIQNYINEGIDKKTAVEMVLQGSVLGAGYKGQIRYDFLGRQLPTS